MKNLFSIKCHGITLLLFLTVNAFAKNIGHNCKIFLREVSFRGSASSGDDHHTLKSDAPAFPVIPPNLPGLKIFDAPHYTNPDNIQDEVRRYPTAYTKRSTPQIQMKFEVDIEIPPGESASINIRADGSDNVDLPWLQNDIPLLNGKHIYTYGWKTATGPFPDEIRFYGPGVGKFEFDWKCSLNKKPAVNFHTSNHRIYLTVAKPEPAAGNRETLFYYACNKPHKDPGKIGRDVTHKIWNDFINKHMPRIDHQSGMLDFDLMKFAPYVTGDTSATLLEQKKVSVERGQHSSTTC